MVSATTLVCLGLNHRTASIELLEKLAFAPAELPAALSRLASAPGVREAAILSTCNRLEVYAVVGAGADAPVGVSGNSGEGLEEAAPVRQAGDLAEGPSLLSCEASGCEGEAGGAAFALLMDWVAQAKGVSAAEVAAHRYWLAGPEVVADHACRVAAGLDSLVLGEAQILGQVAEAGWAAQAAGAAGPTLRALFRAAVRAGKRARHETSIGRHAASLGSVAVRLAESVLGSLAGRAALIVGAGEMAGLAGEALRRRGAARLVVVSRTLGRAQNLAGRWGALARALPLEQLGEGLAEADVVISATRAPHYVISADLVEPALAGRGGRPLVIVDIALPRDVEPAVGALPGVHAYDLGDLQGQAAQALGERQQALPQAEAIAAAEARSFVGWAAGRPSAELIAALRARAEAIRQAEVARTLRQMGPHAETHRAHVEALSEALVNKLLHTATERLKQAPPDAVYAEVVKELFGIDPDRG